MKLTLKIFLFGYTFAFNANAQTYFNKLYDYDQSGTYNNAASTSYEYSNGDFLLGAMKFYSSSFGALHFIRINSLGDTLYSKQYPKPNCAYYTGLSGSLIKCYDGNLAQAGAFYDSTLSEPDVLLVKLTETGDTLWTRTYGGGIFDNANMVCQSPDSGFVLMGATTSFGAGGSDFYLLKIDKNGNLQWQQTYGSALDEGCLSGQITLDGGFILSGHRNNVFYVVKVDSLGVFQWQRIDGSTKGGCFITQLPDSSYILAGAKSVAGLNDQACIMKVNSTGGTIWQKTYGDVVNDWLYSRPIILSDGSIVVSGHTMLGSNPIGMLIKTDSLGNQQWIRTYYANSGNQNYITDVKLTSDNGFIMTGSGNVTGQDAWVVKVDSNGCEIANCNVGVEELNAESFNLKVFPNPATSEINISIEGVDLNNYEITIMNVLGEVQKTKNNHSTISISHLVPGIYFINATSKDGKHRLSRKFTKE